MAPETEAPDIETVGVALIDSLNTAVIVTLLDKPKRLSSSLSLKVVVGAVLSTVKVILSVPAYVFPAGSVPVTVTV